MDYICVLGGANIDVFANSHQKIAIRDSNPATITTALGGVGRNVAENLARLGNKVYLLTVLGNDVNVKLIEDNAKAVGIDLSKAKRVNGVTSTYMCINDSNGDMMLGASDMQILSHLDCDYVKENLELLNNAKAVVIDTNIPNVIEYVCQNVKVHIFLDTVSASKTKYIVQTPFKVFCLKPNLLEAEILSGKQIDGEDDIKEVMQYLFDNHSQWVVLTDGAKGVYYFDGKTFGHVDAHKVQVKNTTGAGDSFISAMISGYVQGWDIEKCVRFGCLIASITVQSIETVSKQVTSQLVKDFN